MEAWQQEKRELLATIRRQERDAAKLARRFKLLQQTLAQQQELLDRYELALAAAGVAPVNRPAQNSEQRDKAGDGSAIEAPTPDEVADTPTGKPDSADRRSEQLEKVVESEKGDAARAEATQVMAAELEATMVTIQPESVDLMSTALAAIQPEDVGLLSRDERVVEERVTKSSPPANETSSGFWTKRRVDLRGKATSSTIDVSTIAAADATTTVSDTRDDSTRKPSMDLGAGKEEERHPPLAPVTKKRPASTWAEAKKQARGLIPARSRLRTMPPSPIPHSKENNVEQSEFAYVEVVRNRAARAALPGHDCAECAKYYAALGGVLDADELAAQKHQCSRHRARFRLQDTPDGFWRLSFPDSVPTPPDA